MKKLIIASLIAPAALGLAACGGTKVDNGSVENVILANDTTALPADDGNGTGDLNATDANAVAPAETTGNMK